VGRAYEHAHAVLDGIPTIQISIGRNNETPSNNSRRAVGTGGSKKVADSALNQNFILRGHWSQPKWLFYPYQETQAALRISTS
jgi:hypothetical protein